MIKSIELQNFQSHKSSRLDFVPGVNVIVGLTDSGKSAIMNAFGWVFNNEPSGEEFRSWWGGDTYILLDLDNGQVARIRKKGFNGYVLGMHEEFVAIKSGVPKEISDFLNINEVNFQWQLDTHFLLSKTPGEVARYFNKIAKLDKIDLANSNINTWVNQINQDIKYKENDLEKSITKLSSFDYLEKFEIEVEVLEEMEKEVKQKKVNYREIKLLINDIVVTDEEIESFQNLIDLEKPINDLLALLAAKKEADIKYGRLNKLIESIKEIQEEIKDAEMIIPSGDLIDELSIVFRQCDELLYNKEKLKKLIQNIKLNASDIQDAQKEFDHLHSQFDKEMGDKCILCGNKIKH